MKNKFDNFSEEEMIDFLNQNGFGSQDEFVEFTQAMERKGLRGSIMAVDDANSEEGITAHEYIEYHKKIDNQYYDKMPEFEVEKAKACLFDKEKSLEDKKLSLLILAHVGRLDVFKVLEEYEKNPDEKLKIWVNLAINECRGFMKSDIMGKPMIDISRVTKIGRNEICPCGSGLKYKKCCL